MFFSPAFIPLCFFQGCKKSGVQWRQGKGFTGRLAGRQRHSPSAGWAGTQKHAELQPSPGLRPRRAVPRTSAQQGARAPRTPTSKLGSDGALLCSGNSAGNTAGNDRALPKG